MGRDSGDFEFSLTRGEVTQGLFYPLVVGVPVGAQFDRGEAGSKHFAVNCKLGNEQMMVEAICHLEIEAQFREFVVGKFAGENFDGFAVVIFDCKLDILNFTGAFRFGDIDDFKFNRLTGDEEFAVRENQIGDGGIVTGLPGEKFSFGSSGKIPHDPLGGK